LKFKIFLISFFFSISSFAAFNRTHLSEDLLGIFGSQCRSVGNFTQNALNQSQALIKMLAELIEDENCGGYANEISSSLNAFRINLEDNSISSDKFEVLLLERNIQELTLALNETSDPVLQSQIASQLSMHRLQLITANAGLGISSDGLLRDRRNIGYYSAQDGLRNLFRQVPNLTNCSGKFRKLATQIVGGALSTASYFVNPALGAAMSGAAGAVTALTDAIYQIWSYNEIRKLNDINLPTALSCSAEVLTNMYCDTLRAEKVIAKYANYDEESPTKWQGVHFIYRQLPPLVDWLELVRAGSPAADSFDALRRLEIMGHNSQLDELKQKLDGFISETDREMKTLNIDFNNYVATKIDTLVSQLVQSKPIETLNGRDYLPFRLIGFKDIPKCNFQGQIQPCPNLQTFKVFYAGAGEGGNTGYQFSLTDWAAAKENVQRIYGEARDFVNNQLSLILNEDGDSVVAQAFEGFQGKMAPKDILIELNRYAGDVRNYLIKYNEANQYGPQILNIETSQILILKVLDLLHNRQAITSLPIATNSPELMNETAGKVLGEIYSILNLKVGQRFLMDRIKNIVRWDIISRMKNNDFDYQLIEMIQFNNTNIISDITSYGMVDYQEMVNDIQNSKTILKGTLVKFFDMMNLPYMSALKMIEKNDLERGVKDKLCIHLLSSPELIKRANPYSYNIRKICKGAIMKSVLGSESLQIKFDDYLNGDNDFKGDFDNRACLYNNFMRQAKIREQFKK
jgi:hypothetical protein